MVMPPFLQRIFLCITFHWTVTRLPTLKLVSG